MAAYAFGINNRAAGDDPRRLEELGYDSAWAGEHILFHFPTNDALIEMAAVAAQTTTLKIGSGVYLLPLRHPVPSAKAIATLDHVARGRVILGVGVGGEYPKEFEACGVPINERGRRTDESIDILRLLWTEDHVSYHGRIFQIDDVTMRPKPVQAHIPIWIGGRSEAALRRAARRADGYLPYLVSVRRFRENREKLIAYAGELGRDLSGFTWGLHIFVTVAATYEAARSVAARRLQGMYQQDFESIAGPLNAIGTAEQVAAKLLEFGEAGARYFVLNLLGEPESLPAMAEQIARDVIPLMR